MDLATIQIKVDTREVKAANDDIGKLGRTGTQASKDVNAANDSMVKSTGRVSAAYKALGGVMAALGVGALVSSFASTVTATERLRGSLVTMTGSTENAAFAFDKLLGFASTTPFTLDQSVEAFTKLTALGLTPSERALQSYGNTAAAMGKDMMQMIEAVADATTGEFERLKEFGIKAKSEGDRVSFTFQGMTTTIGKNAAEIEEYLMGIGEVNFAGAMENQMKRLPGLLSNLSDQVTKFFLAIGEAGGINAFGAAISAASTAIVFATENLDILGTAFMAAAAAAGVAFGPTMILAAISAVQTAVIALYKVIAFHPFAALAMALGAAAVIMIRHWDAIKKAAQSAAINIQIGWNKLMLFLMNAFAPVLSSITDLFKDIQRQAIATWTAVKAATMDPLNAIETFNSTFDETLEALEQGDQSAGVFGIQIRTTRNRIEELYGELETLNAETELADDNFVEAERSLSDFQVQIDETAVAAAAAEVEMEAMRTKALEVLGAISNEQEALHLSNLELEIRNNLQKAGVDATSELGEQIIAATTELHNEKAALDAASTAADELAKANEEAQKKIEEDTKATKDAISGFFVDLFTNGQDAFKNIGDSFKAMLVKMLADWAASRVMEIISGGFSNLGSSISSMFSGIFSSISSTISGLASAAAAVLGGGGGAAGTAAASVAAATSAAATSAAVTGGINTAALAAGSGLAAGTTAGFTAPGALAGTTAVTGLTSGTTAATTAATTGTTAAATGGGISSALQTLGPAALFGYLALKWDIFGLNRPNYPSFDELPPAVQAQELLEAFEANAQPFMMGLGPEDTEGMAGFEPAVLIDLYRRIKGRLGTDASDTLSKIENHPLLQTSLYDMVDGSFKDGLYNVPHDGFVAELHAGERVLTAQEANARDSMAMDIASLRGSIEEIMIAVARNTAKSYRLYDRWDKNGLPPTRA